MSMSGQASNMTFSDSAIQRAVIERVFDERKKYLIIALTGKIGAGSSYVSSFIQKASNGEEIPCSSSECNNYSSDEERADNILLRYFECNRIPFHVIRVRDVITSFIVENDAWTRLAVRQQNIKKAESDIMRLLHGKLDRLLSNIVLQPGGGSAFIDGKKVSRNEAAETSTTHCFFIKFFCKSVQFSVVRQNNEQSKLNLTVPRSSRKSASFPHHIAGSRP